jgi:hypothetical protein
VCGKPSRPGRGEHAGRGELGPCGDRGDQREQRGHRGVAGDQRTERRHGQHAHPAGNGDGGVVIVEVGGRVVLVGGRETGAEQRHVDHGVSRVGPFG